MKNKTKALVLILISLICIVLNFIFEFDVADVGFWLGNTAFVCIVIANLIAIREWKAGKGE